MYKVFILLCMFFMNVNSTYASQKNAEEAIGKAASSGKYLFITFYENKDSNFSSMKSSINEFTKTTKKTAKYDAKVSDPVNSDIIKKYGIPKSGNLPLLLVIAPNGVITGGFPKSVTQEKLKESMNVSDLMLNIRKPLQDGKIVFVVLQNSKTTFNKESSKGVNDFMNDPQYNKYATTIKYDPSLPEAKEFLKQCGITSELKEATVILVRPPGKIGCIKKGKVTKEEFIQSLHSCAGGC